MMIEKSVPKVKQYYSIEVIIAVQWLFSGLKPNKRNLESI